MKLHGMAKAFAELAARPDADALSHAEWLAILLEREGTRLTMALKRSPFRANAEGV
jgi:hypothetical protein